LPNWLIIFEDICGRVHERLGEVLSAGQAGERMGLGAGGDVSFRADIVAEEAVIEGLKERGIECNLVMEERGLVRLGEGPWIAVDALDGSKNAIRGLGPFATSLALSPTPRLEDVELAYVLEHTSQRAFYAVRGGGAYEGSRRIKAKGAKHLNEAIVGLDLCSISEAAQKRVAPVALSASAIRHLGSNAYELCLVACGALDAHVDLRRRIRPLDIAAGALIVAEAGGLIGDERGQGLASPLSPSARLNVIAAAEKELFLELVQLLSS
jgi:myo-inositol-1(or 4)-monophosphatase